MGADNFPNTKQTIGSMTCGPVSLLNIYTHFDKKISLDQILKDLKITVNDPTHTIQLGRHLLKNACTTELLTSNTFSVAPEWRGAPTAKIIEELKEWVVHHHNDMWCLNATYMLFYLQEGGSIQVVDLTTQLLDAYLDKGYVLLLALEESWIWGKRKIYKTKEFDTVLGATTGHFVVIFDKKEDTYLISDPFPTGLPNREGLYAVPKDTLLVSCLLWGGQVLAVKG